MANMQEIIWRLVLLVIAILCAESAETTLKIHGGKIRGVWSETSNQKLFSFLGIPYAVPPVGNLRFRAPVPFPIWTNILDATLYQNECLRNGIPNDVSADEDCLYLNVFIPNNPNLMNNSNLLSTVVFLDNSMHYSTEDNIMDKSKYATENDVIAVTLSYRRDIFGFLSTGKNIPGNFGLLDQVIALKWINDNIKHFGGDADNIVIVGDHNIVSLHISSPLNRGLFRGAVSLDTVILQKPVEVGYSNTFFNSEVLKHFCDKRTNMNFESCFRVASANDLLNVSVTTTLAYPWQPSPYSPVIDNYFLKDIPSKVFTKGGQNNVDYMVFQRKTKSKIKDMLKNSKCEQETFLKVIEYVTNQINFSNANLISDTLKTIYYPEQSTTESWCVNIEKLFEDFQTSEILTRVNEHSRAGLTFLLLLESNGMSSAATADGTGEIDWCIFGDPTSHECITKMDSYKTLQMMIRNFIKHSFPLNDDGAIWRPYTKASRNHLLFSNGAHKQGNARTWPYQRLELLWRTFLPQLSANLTQKTQNGHNMEDSDFYETNWGLNQHQVEALIFSLILITLFLLCINMGLFRIICHLRGKRFYKRTKPGILTSDNADSKDRKRSICNGHTPIEDSGLEMVDTQQTDVAHITEMRDVSKL